MNTKNEEIVKVKMVLEDGTEKEVDRVVGLDELLCETKKELEDVESKIEQKRTDLYELTEKHRAVREKLKKEEKAKAEYEQCREAAETLQNYIRAFTDAGFDKTDAIDIILTLYERGASK